MSRFLPNAYQKNIYTIDYKNLYNKGIKCILFDLDNTLIGTKENTINEKLINHIKELKKIGFKPIIFSNGLKRRVNKIKKELNIEAISFAKKPYKINFLKIMQEYKYNPNEIAIVGDQLLTDIYGGNKVGITTILIEPLSNKDGIFTKVNRIIEKRIYRQFKKNKKLEKGKYYE